MTLSTSRVEPLFSRSPPPPAAHGFPVRDLGGLPIVVCDRAQSALWLDAVGRAGTPERPPIYVTSANGEVLSRATDPSIRALFLSADMIHADGQSLVLASRLLGGTALPERVATTDLLHDVARLAERSGTSFYLLGGSAPVMAAAVGAMRRAYPRLIIVGARHGYFSPDEEAAVVADIVKARPGILWVGMGVPREQAFVVRNLQKLRGVGAIKTSGGLFDFLAGRRSRAPQWMQTAGLEWLYRAWLEPRRLAMRYLTTNPHALYLMLRRPGR